MLRIEEILEEVTRFSKMAMEAERKLPEWLMDSLFKEEYRERRLPEYYPGYRRVVENYEAIMVHADRNIFPARIFARRAPNQTEKAARWIYDNYKNVTQPVFLDFLNTVLRSTHDTNWGIEYDVDSDEIITSRVTFQQYIEKELHGYGSLENFFKSILFDVKLKDAMGVIAVKPHRLPTEVNEEGEVVISSTELIEPLPYYYTCKQVVKFEAGIQAYIELHERSWVRYGNTKEQRGRIYEIYDDQNIYRAVQVGKYIDNTFEVYLYYNHGWGNLPVERLKGVAQIKEEKLVYDSQFLFAVDHLDLVLQNSAYQQASIAKCVFPATVMLGDVCQFEDKERGRGRCEEGWLRWGVGESFREERCPECHGIGLVSRLGPLDTLLLRPQQRGVNDGEELKSTQKPLEYVSPEVHTLEFLSDNIEKHEEKARKILHMQTSNSTTKGTENLTATGMVLDAKSMYAFIQPIAYQAFELLEFMCQAIGWMRYGEKFKAPKITYPQSFEIGTASDILQLINELIQNKMPPILIQSEVIRYLKASFYTDTLTSRVYQLVIDSDRLLVMDSVDIALAEKNGKVAKWESVLHDSSITFINELYQANPKFFDQTLNIQKDQLIQKAKDKLSEIEIPVIVPDVTQV